MSIWSALAADLGVGAMSWFGVRSTLQPLVMV